MHNAPYRITVQWRYGVYMKGARGPFQTSITIHVQNLVVTSPDVGKVLRWDPEKGITDTSFSYKIECAQKKQVSVRVRIYDLSGNVVYEVMEQKLCPGGYSFSWDGTMNTGYYGYPPEEGSNIAPAGLYTFDVEVEANPYDRDELRGRTLSVDSVLGGLYYDDKGTEDESDDEEFLVVEYVLKSDRNASSGEIWLYDPDFNQIGRWDVYGLTASQTGVQHEIAISVSNNLIDLANKPGIYYVVLCFKDNHLDKYKNHVIKPSLEVGSSGYCGAIFVGENIDETYYFEWPDLEFQPDNEGAPLSSSQYQIPEGAKVCPSCKGSGAPEPGVWCNGSHTIIMLIGDNKILVKKYIIICLDCNGLGYSAETWPFDKFSVFSDKPPTTNEPDVRKIPRSIRDQVNKIANEIIGYDPNTGQPIKRGCHSCGAQTPGTKSGDWIPDHHPAVAIVKLFWKQFALEFPNRPPFWALLPYCKRCSDLQMRRIRDIKNLYKKWWNKPCTRHF